MKITIPELFLVVLIGASELVNLALPNRISNQPKLSHQIFAEV